MRGCWLVVTLLGACATTSRTCPYESTLVTEDPPSGRVETCATAATHLEELPISGVTYEAALTVARPQPRYGALDGPFTHWYPDGTIESHGNYVRDGETSVPDGVWGFWYADGTRKSVGRYTRGKPIGCFAAWDEHGLETTAILDGDQARVAACPPPIDDSITSAEARSHPRDGRSVWGDISLDTIAQTGAFGAYNVTAGDVDASAFGAGQLAVRTNVGDFRLGGMVGYRLSSSANDHAYEMMAIAAYRLPLPIRGLAAEIEARVGAEYLDVVANHFDDGLWAPVVGGRVDLAYSVLDSLAIVLGATVETMPARQSIQPSEYCTQMPFLGGCTMYAQDNQTWQVGGTAYGIDVGLRINIR